MVLVVDKKFLEGEWWRYALAIFLLQVFFWVLLGFKLNPDFELPGALIDSRIVIGAFFVATYLPFIAGRLQMRKLFWFAFVGLILSIFSYYALSLAGAGSRFSLLPFIGFLQVYVSCFGLGVIVEFGRYVFRKLGE